jgi:hypothetical protein
LAAAFYSSICDALATLGSHYSRQQQRALSKPSLSLSALCADLLLVLNQVVAFNIQEVYIFLIGPHCALNRSFLFHWEQI